MKARTPINVTQQWRKSEGDNSICHLCQLPIQGLMFTNWVTLNGELRETNTKLHARCFDTL